MARSDRSRHPLVIIAIIGALITLTGAIMSWIEFGRDAKTDYTPRTHVFIFLVAIGVLVPFFSILAHIRRASQLFALAFAAAIVGMIMLVESTNTYVFLMNHASYRQPSHLPVRLAGMILQMVGLLASLAPVFRGSRVQGLPIAASGFVALLWFIAGIMFATQLKNIYTTGVLNGRYSTASATFAFLFGLWALLCGLTRSTSLSVGLGVATILQWSYFVNEVNTAIPPHSRKENQHTVIGAADALAIAATGVWLLWVCYDFCREKVYDRIKHQHKEYMSLN